VGGGEDRSSGLKTSQAREHGRHEGREKAGARLRPRHVLNWQISVGHTKVKSKG
jgi:hypothetical protein